jgi:SAM-dependent methyltransferase
MPPQPLSAEYFDDWYAGKAATPTAAEITNRLLGLPADLSAGVVPADALPELLAGLRLRPGDTLLDLACGRAGYGLTVAQATGAALVGVDFSARALAEAREQAARLGVTGATFHVGELTASGLPDASADAVLCTDSIQFPDHPADAYREIRRVLKPGGRVVLTCWEPVTPGDERLSPRLRHVDLAAGLGDAGFTGIIVDDRPAWRDRERALWEAAAAIDPGDDPGLQSFHDEGVRSLDHFDLIHRVLATATAPRDAA